MKYTQPRHTSLTVPKVCSWQLSDTAPAADVELSDDGLREVEMIMKDAVPRRAVA